MSEIEQYLRPRLESKKLLSDALNIGHVDQRTRAALQISLDSVDVIYDEWENGHSGDGLESMFNVIARDHLEAPIITSLTGMRLANLAMDKGSLVNRLHADVSPASIFGEQQEWESRRERLDKFLKGKLGGRLEGLPDRVYRGYADVHKRLSPLKYVNGLMPPDLIGDYASRFPIVEQMNLRRFAHAFNGFPPFSLAEMTDIESGVVVGRTIVHPLTSSLLLAHNGGREGFVRKTLASERGAVERYGNGNMDIVMGQGGMLPILMEFGLLLEKAGFSRGVTGHTFTTAIMALNLEEIVRQLNKDPKDIKFGLYGLGSITRAALGTALRKLDVSANVTINAYDIKNGSDGFTRAMRKHWDADVTVRDVLTPFALLDDSDVILSATGSPRQVLTAGHLLDRDGSLKAIVLEDGEPSAADPLLSLGVYGIDNNPQYDHKPTGNELPIGPKGRAAFGCDLERRTAASLQLGPDVTSKYFIGRTTPEAVAYAESLLLKYGVSTDQLHTKDGKRITLDDLDLNLTY